jgi:2-oxoglutarate ferredoxin oxidoreductase subunit gamma
MTEDKQQKLIIAGFGGQGILLAGKLLANAAMVAGKEVTYMPSYGAEVRGGTANCMVIISNEPVACPLISTPSSVITLNAASLKKFAPRLGQNGLLIYNKTASIEKPNSVADGVTVIAVPMDQIAFELGSPRCVNMVALGAYLAVREVVPLELLVEVLPKVLARRYHKMIDVNRQAIQRGAKFVQKNLSGISSS